MTGQLKVTCSPWQHVNEIPPSTIEFSCCNISRTCTCDCNILCTFLTSCNRLSGRLQANCHFLITYFPKTCHLISYYIHQSRSLILATHVIHDSIPVNLHTFLKQLSSCSIHLATTEVLFLKHESFFFIIRPTPVIMISYSCNTSHYRLKFDHNSKFLHSCCSISQPNNVKNKSRQPYFTHWLLKTTTISTQKLPYFPLETWTKHLKHFYSHVDY